MSATTIAIPSLSQSVCGLLSILSGGGTEGRVHVSARSRHGFGQRELFLPCGRRNFIDGPIAALLEDDLWSLEVGLLVFEETSSRFLRMSALVTSWRLPHIYRHPDLGRPEETSGRQWLPDERRAAEILRELESFPLGPSMIVDSAASRFDAVWALADPVPLRSPSDRQRAHALLHDLAVAVHADPPAGKDEHLVDLSVPLPGSVVREPPYDQVVTCLSLDMTRIYTIDQITAVVAGRE